VKRGESSFVVKENTPVVADGAAVTEARKLQDLLAPAMGFRLNLIEGTQFAEGGIALKIADSTTDVGAEGYKLEVTPTHIAITGRDAAGLFYAGGNRLVYKGQEELRRLSRPAAGTRETPAGPRHQLPAAG
jgi:hexosaminidase